jgi:hypothetical protein
MARSAPEWSYQIDCLEDVQRVRREVGLPFPCNATSPDSKAKREHYVLLAFLVEASMASNLIPTPIKLRQGNPPDEPDFVAECGSTPTWFEVTEASDTADRQENAKLLRSHQETIFIGEFGGRFADGIVDAVKPWIGDIVAAIERKTTKVVCRTSHIARHILIYPNSNASYWMDEREERRAFGNLRASLALKQEQLPITVNGCWVHVVGRHFVAFDILRRMQFRRKRFVCLTCQ